MLGKLNSRPDNFRWTYDQNYIYVSINYKSEHTTEWETAMQTNVWACVRSGHIMEHFQKKA